MLLLIGAGVIGAPSSGRLCHAPLPAVINRRAVLFSAPLACLVATAAEATTADYINDVRLANVGTAEERLRRSGALDTKNNADPRCQSGVFLNFKPGTCSPVGNIYDRMASSAPKAQKDALDDLAADFMKKSGISEADDQGN